MRPLIGRLFALAATLAVVAAVTLGFWLLTPPAEERLYRLDQSRINDLSGISWAMNAYWARHKSLPATMDALINEPDLGTKQADPTGLPYEYRIIDGGIYELCATFARPSIKDAGNRENRFWLHGAGHKCFRLEARSIR